MRTRDARSTLHVQRRGYKEEARAGAHLCMLTRFIDIPMTSTGTPGLILSPRPASLLNPPEQGKIHHPHADSTSSFSSTSWVNASNSSSFVDLGQSSGSVSGVNHRKRDTNYYPMPCHCLEVDRLKISELVEFERVRGHIHGS